MPKLSEHFTSEEFACHCGCGFDQVDLQLIEELERIREAFGNRPIEVVSGCRCLKYNRNVGGARNSQHMLGTAADIRISGVSPQGVQDELKGHYYGRYGIGSYQTFTHFDVRSGRAVRWSA